MPKIFKNKIKKKIVKSKFKKNKKSFPRFSLIKSNINIYNFSKNNWNFVGTNKLSEKKKKIIYMNPKKIKKIKN